MSELSNITFLFYPQAHYISRVTALEFLVLSLHCQHGITFPCGKTELLADKSFLINHTCHNTTSKHTTELPSKDVSFLFIKGIFLFYLTGIFICYSSSMKCREYLDKTFSLGFLINPTPISKMLGDCVKCK